MTLRKWSYFRRSEDLTEPLHTRIYLFSSLLSFIIEISSKLEYHQRFTSGEEGGGRDNNMVKRIVGKEWNARMKKRKYRWMNFYSVRSCGLASFFFFSFVARRNGLRGSRSPDSNGFHRFRYFSTEGDRDRERERANTARFELSLSEKRSRSFRSALSKRFHCIAYVHKPLEYDTKIFHTTISLRFHDIVRVQWDGFF